MVNLNAHYLISQAPSWFLALQHSAHDWQFRSEPTDKACRSIKNGCYWPRGKMLGGTHSLNGMVYLRGNKRDYDDWSNLGNPSWDWQSVLKYFKKSESNKNQTLVNNQNGKWHNDHGAMAVGHYHQSEALRSVFIDTAKEMGYDFVQELNADATLGYANAQGTINDGRRVTTANAFLASAKDRPNLHVIKHALVSKVLIDTDNSVSGVEFDCGKTLQAKALKEVIISAGAVSSPQLLMLSGIGPHKHLQQHKIPLKKNLSVGKNLQDHLIIPIVLQFHKSTAEPESAKDMLDNLYNFAVHKKGPLTGIGMINLVGFINTVNQSGYPDIEVQHFNYNRKSFNLEQVLRTMGYEDDVIEPIIKANEVGEILIVFVELLRPASSGEILLRSANPNDKPKIFANYLAEDEDVQTLLRGVKYQAAFVHSDVFKQHEGELVRIPFADCDKFEYISDDYWKCYMSYMSTTVYHPVGTNKMGPNSDEQAVVDHHLNVKGINGLRVIDASIMPKMVSANVNAATIMIAEKGADFIRMKWASNLEKQEL